jgi:hypothetical protein
MDAAVDGIRGMPDHTYQATKWTFGPGTASQGGLSDTDDGSMLEEDLSPPLGLTSLCSHASETAASG